jgi:hypothetical protein
MGRQVHVTPGMLARYATEIEQDPSPRPVAEVMTDVQAWAATQPMNQVTAGGQAVGELIFAAMTSGGGR